MKKYSIIGIFIFAIFLRLWNLNQMGRTWDENFFVEQGYRMVDLFTKRDFSNRFWYKAPDPPPVPKYFYGLAEHFRNLKTFENENIVLPYDFTRARITSVIFSSLTVLIVILIGSRYISLFAGIASGVILSMLPLFLGFSQLATIESPLIFFFTASVYAFLRLLEDISNKKLIIAGILLGLAMLTKYTNILLVPLFFFIYILWYFIVGKPEGKKFLQMKIVYIFPVALLTAFVLWPMPWFNLQELSKYMYDLRVTTNALPVPEVFFGKLMLVPKVYYFVYFIITTPFVILMAFLLGLKKISDLTSHKITSKNKWILLALVVWFCFPFAQSLYNFRQHGIRYIIEIYAPLALIGAIGIDYLAKIISKKTVVNVFLIIFIFFYLLIINVKISPYYLDYFSELVGGPKNVYDKRLFQMGWWGQGIKEAGLYLENNAKKGSEIGLALSPSHVFPPIKNFKVFLYKDGKTYDYVVVNYYNIIREGFNDSKIREKYKPVYFVKVDRAILVTVYKKQNK